MKRSFNVFRANLMGYGISEVYCYFIRTQYFSALFVNINTNNNIFLLCRSLPHRTVESFHNEHIMHAIYYFVKSWKISGKKMKIKSPKKESTLENVLWKWPLYAGKRTYNSISLFERETFIFPSILLQLANVILIFVGK